MFTGIVQEVGSVVALRRLGASAKLDVAASSRLLSRLRPGDSIAVNGCCLTLVRKTRGRCPIFNSDLSAETLARTALGQLELGAPVNLETPVRAGDLLSGHIVQGHIEGVAKVVSLKPVGDGFWLDLQVPKQLLRYIVGKGALTVDGISLTVARIRGSRIGFAIIPFTYAHTNVRSYVPNTLVNIETDPIARHIERLLPERPALTEN